MVFRVRIYQAKFLIISFPQPHVSAIIVITVSFVVGLCFIHLVVCLLVRFRAGFSILNVFSVRLSNGISGGCGVFEH